MRKALTFALYPPFFSDLRLVVPRATTSCEVNPSPDKVRAEKGEGACSLALVDEGEGQGEGT